MPRILIALGALAALTACPTTPADTGDPQCGSTMAFVTGTVDHYDPAGVEVHAKLADNTGDTLVATSDSAGHYELDLQAANGPVTYNIAGVYHLGSFDECWTPDTALQVSECTEYTLDITAFECMTADKPNLYLYPLADTLTRVSLQLEAKQAVVASAPEYGDGWSGTAHPDGSFTVDGERAPFLFYEVTLAPGMAAQHLQRAEGWCVPGQGAVEAIADLLGRYGFNERERQDFVDGWRDDLPVASSYAVYPELDVSPMAGLTVEPPLPLHRLWFTVTDGVGCDLPEPVVTPFDRSGAHGVEWGVVLQGL